ncbi:MAG: MBL fold metallo-hydrolase [Thermoanaerobaculia bacterium]
MNVRSAAFLMLALACAGCGHVIRGEFAPNHSGPAYDFAEQKCARERPPGTGPEEVFVRYLGAGGLYLEWRGTPVLVGPFFSNPSFPRAFFGRLATDRVRIDGGLKGMDLAGVQAILVGHAHYDHLADVPDIVEKFSPGAEIYVNRTGANMLAGVPSMSGKVHPLEDERDFRISPLIRVRAVESEHAPLFWHLNWARGQVEKPWTEDWTHHGFRQLKAGTTFAFVIDLLDDLGAVRYRIYYQDAASPEGKGVPDFEDASQPGYDLAVLCMASFNFVKNHPGGILDKLHPRHVLVTHYENFARGPQQSLRFVPLLTNGGANFFLGKVRTSVDETGARGPTAEVCGPSSRVSTMPLPGEWLRFQALPR